MKIHSNSKPIIEIQCNCSRWIDFCFGLRFWKMHPPRRAGKRTPKIVNIPKCLDLIDSSTVLTISTCKLDPKTPQMYLNTSQNCFEGPRGRKIGFSRDPKDIHHHWVRA